MTTNQNRLKITRNSAIADKLRDAFRGQSRSPNVVPIHNVRYGFLLVCYSNFVPNIFRYSTSKCHDFENRVRVHSRLPLQT